MKKRLLLFILLTAAISGCTLQKQNSEPGTTNNDFQSKFIVYEEKDVDKNQEFFFQIFGLSDDGTKEIREKQDFDPQTSDYYRTQNRAKNPKKKTLLGINGKGEYFVEDIATKERTVIPTKINENGPIFTPYTVDEDSFYKYSTTTIQPEGVEKIGKEYIFSRNDKSATEVSILKDAESIIGVENNNDIFLSVEAIDTKSKIALIKVKYQDSYNNAIPQTVYVYNYQNKEVQELGLPEGGVPVSPIPQNFFSPQLETITLMNWAEKNIYIYKKEGRTYKFDSTINLDVSECLNEASCTVKLAWNSEHSFVLDAYNESFIVDLKSGDVQKQDNLTETINDDIYFKDKENIYIVSPGVIQKYNGQTRAKEEVIRGDNSYFTILKIN